MSVFVPVITGVTAIERDRDRLLSLGTLAAGLAHELNNPAAAAQRVGIRAAGGRARRPGGALAARRERARCGRDGAALHADGGGSRSAEAAPTASTASSAPTARRSSQRGSRSAESPTAALPLPRSSMRGSTRPGRRACSRLRPGEPDSVVGWVASRLTAARIARELEDSTERISQLVQSVRQYSYLDQAQRQEVDVHEGLESTLAILAHKVAGARDRDRPRVRPLAAADRGERARAEPGLDEPHRQRARCRRTAG